MLVWFAGSGCVCFPSPEWCRRPAWLAQCDRPSLKCGLDSNDLQPSTVLCTGQGHVLGTHQGEFLKVKKTFRNQWSSCLHMLDAHLIKKRVLRWKKTEICKAVVSLQMFVAHLGRSIIPSNCIDNVLFIFDKPYCTV